MSARCVLPSDVPVKVKLNGVDGAATASAETDVDAVGLYGIRPGTIVTVDALNCQRDIARRIVDQGGAYVLALKGNQGTLHSDVTLFLEDPETRPMDTHTTVNGDHGRIETRACSISTDIRWLRESHQWPGLAAIGKVVRTRETRAKVITETAYYPLSAPLSADRFGQVARSHWAVENSLHWCLDVIMNEDNARNRLGSGPHNLAILRHMALNLIRKEPSKGSLRVKIKRAGWKERISRKSLRSNLKCDSPGLAPQCFTLSAE